MAFEMSLSLQVGDCACLVAAIDVQDCIYLSAINQRNTMIPSDCESSRLLTVQEYENRGLMPCVNSCHSRLPRTSQ